MKILNEKLQNIIFNNGWLEDDHIDYFAQLLHQNFGYEFRESWSLQMPDNIIPIPKNKIHIQLLHKMDVSFNNRSAHSMLGGHWVCSYYDTNSIYILDSNNSKILHPHFQAYLQHLYPYFSFEQKPVIFPNVQQQSNSHDCGVFAIAFATSLVHGKLPQNLKYDAVAMRKHLFQIFKSQIISEFPSNNMNSSYINTGTSTFTTRYDERKNAFTNLNAGGKEENILNSNKDSQLHGKSSRASNPKKTNIFILDNISKRIIETGQKLTDLHMTSFGMLINRHTTFSHQDTLLIQRPEKIVPIDLCEKHIQILHSSCNDHWICTYYDAKHIYVYDSLNNKTLNQSQKIYLQHLYPQYFINNNPIHFPKVQYQPNSVDCGVFAIAFATSLIFHQKPENLIYDHVLMRKHLLEMFESNTILHFPAVDKKHKKLQLLPLNKLNKREKAALRERRKSRMKYKNSDHVLQKGSKCNNMESQVCKQTMPDSDARKIINKSKQSSTVGNLDRNSDNHLYDFLKRKIRTEVLMRNNMNSRNLKRSSDDRLDNFLMKTIRKDSLTHSFNENGVSPKQVKRFKYDDDVDRKLAIDDSVQLLNDNDKLSSITSYKHDQNENGESSKQVKRFKYDSGVDKMISQICDVNKSQLVVPTLSIITKNVKITNTLNSENESVLQSKGIRMTLNKETCIIKLLKVLDDDTSLFNDPIENRLLSEQIINWCFAQRNIYINQLKNCINQIREKSNYYYTIYRASKGIGAQLKNLCGRSLHTPTTEAYFCNTAYFFVNNEPIVINHKCQAVNILQIEKCSDNRIRWKCDHNCKTFYITKDNNLFRSDTIKNYDEFIENRERYIINVISKYVTFLEKMKTLTFRNVCEILDQLFVKHSFGKLGHLESCYTSSQSCDCLFIIVWILSPHYPAVRAIKSLIYRMRLIVDHLVELDQAFENVDYKILKKVHENMLEKGCVYLQKEDTICLNETQIYDNYKNAFIALTKRSVDTPRIVCACCQKLCYERDIQDINKLYKPIFDNALYKSLLKYLNDTNSKINSHFMCKYCLSKIRNNKCPPTCIMNHLEVGSIPNEMVDLNAYEKLLIQRAKAFQVVQRMGTVSKKSLPNRMKIQKLKGTTLHLPLPLEETLNKICSVTEPINKNHELYILVNGLPSNDKKIWQSLVNMKKVFETLNWLKSHNQLYSEIKLPKCSEHLFDHLSSVEYPIEKSDSQITINDEIQKSSSTSSKSSKHNDVQLLQEDEEIIKSPFLTQVTDLDKVEEEYTIYPMYNQRLNKDSITLYQMKKIREDPLDNRLATLDLLCFPDLHPLGKNGEHEEDRVFPLSDNEYAKVRLMSVDARFRLNVQYIFYLLSKTYIRQINSGIYHLLHTINPKKRYTVNEYLQNLDNGNLEGKLTTIFERLRNTPQFWSRPRNNLRCMIFYYGPATWFVTLSPAEYNWSDLIQYVRDINSPHFDKLSNNEIIASDPVSVSRFIENKFQAMLQFLLSQDNPIGEIDHYFWRREYQGRGIQHFHCIFWVKNAPILGKNTNEEVINFILKYITCSILEKNTSPELYRKVNSYQKHNHNSYCLRKKRCVCNSHTIEVKLQ